MLTVSKTRKTTAKPTGLIEIKGNPKMKLNTVKKATFPLTFNFVKRDPNDFPIENILEREVDEYREKYVEEL